MNAKTAKWVLVAILVLALAWVVVTIGSTLLPPQAEAQQKGIIVPWYITWGMVWGTVVLAVAVAGSLFMTGLNKGRSGPHPAAGRR
jgi:uncharacterized membrane protein YphA (DoxX/SURF4 family)